MYSVNLFDVTHRAHDVVAKLNQRQWRLFNVSTRSCAIHVTYTSPSGLCHDNWFIYWTILWKSTHCLPRQTTRSIRDAPLYMWEGARVFVGCNFFYLCKKTIFYLVVNFRQFSHVSLKNRNIKFCRMPNSLLRSLRYHFMVHSGEHIFFYLFHNLLSDFSCDKLFSFFKWEWKWIICFITILHYIRVCSPPPPRVLAAEWGALSGNNVFLLLDKWLITSHKDRDVSMSILSQTTDVKAWYEQHEITEITLQKSVAVKSRHWTNDGLMLASATLG